MTSGGLGEVIARTRYVLLDFDGPICSVFAGIPAPAVASRLTEILLGAGVAPPVEITDTDDPFDVLRYALAHAPDLAADIETAFRAEELTAIASATPTPGATATIRACHDTGRPVAIVSNNSEAAIRAYLTHHALADQIARISTRTPADVARLKPHPYLVIQAIHGMDADLASCVLVGDSTTDIQAAHATGIAAIGYANAANKTHQLTNAGAEAIITHMTDLANALRFVRFV
ncbi:MAG: HAD family phosphatase [Pseudonocardiales bacterium]|nr:HAD family phosphatase [Pseudonocardiales bacterium]